MDSTTLLIISSYCWFSAAAAGTAEDAGSNQRVCLYRRDVVGVTLAAGHLNAPYCFHSSVPANRRSLAALICATVPFAQFLQRRMLSLKRGAPLRNA
jgi:hypothetical protein